MKKWKVHASNYIYQTPWGNLRSDTCELPNGFIIDHYYVQEYVDWVNAFVLTTDYKVVLVEQYRHPSGQFMLEIPAGSLEDNESPEAGILREVREETGFTSKVKPIPLGEYWVNPATQTNKVINYLILYAEKVYEQQLDKTEEVKIHLVDFNEIETWIKDQKITQYFTVSSFYMVKSFLQSNNNKNDS